MKSVITVSVSQAQKAWNAINDCSNIKSQLHQTASNTWETDDYDETDDESQEYQDYFLYEVQAIFRSYGITEYEIDDVEE